MGITAEESGARRRQRVSAAPYLAGQGWARLRQERGAVAAHDRSQRGDLRKTQRRQPCLGIRASEQAGNS